MMTQQLGFSILTAPIAALDRRALSQAWYSALYLARDPASPAAQAKQPPGGAVAQTSGSVEPKRDPKRERLQLKATAASEHAPVRAQPREVDRRSLRSPLARKIERAFLRPAPRPVRSTFTLGGEARVHVTLQSAGGGLRLIAVCAPRCREAVARALEEARYALAARGISLDARVGG
jgi:hypothetical protein